MKTASYLFLFAGTFVTSVWGASINFTTNAEFTFSGDTVSDPQSGDNGTGFQFITSTYESGGSPFDSYFYAGSVATVNGWIGVSTQSRNYYGGQPLVSSMASWNGVFTNPYAVAQKFEIDLSFGAGSLFVTLGSYGLNELPRVDAFIDVSVDYLGATYPVMNSTAKLTYNGFFVAGDSIDWQPGIVTETSKIYGFEPFHFKNDSPEIAPGAIFSLTYSMRIDALHVVDYGGYGGSGSGGFMNDPFDVNGNLRTEAPTDFGSVTVMPAAASSVPEPSTLAVTILSAFLAGADFLRRRRPRLRSGASECV